MEVTGISVAKAQEIADSAIVDGDIDGSGNLVLTNGGGAQFNAGLARVNAVVSAAINGVGKLIFTKHDGSTVDAGSVALAAWPVGSIYTSMAAANPSTLFGGTWTRIAVGRVIVGQDPSDADFDTAAVFGGSKVHRHSNTYFRGGGPIPGNGQPGLSIDPDAANYVQVPAPPTGPNVPGAVIDGNTSLQPYVVAYIWQRTA